MEGIDFYGDLENALETLEIDPSPMKGKETQNEFDLLEYLNCLAVSTEYYCPLWGWTDEDIPLSERVDEKKLNTPALQGGDLGFEQLLTSILRMSADEQRSLLREDLNEAVGAVGKVLTEESVREGNGITDELLETFPVESAALMPDGETFSSFHFDDAHMTPMSTGMTGVKLITSTTAKKQEKSYWCGPASAAFMGLHDPVVKNTMSHTQAAWATRLGTTTAGTSIYNFKNAVNSHMTGWKNRVNGYVVKSISGWTVNNWITQLGNTIYVKRAPMILHPKLNSSVSNYVPAGKSTGGHFNVAYGWTGYANGNVTVHIFEPYSFDGALPQVLVNDSV